MSPAGLDPLTAHVPAEPMFAPAGSATSARGRADDFDEHLRRAQSTAEPPGAPAQGAASSPDTAERAEQEAGDGSAVRTDAPGTAGTAGENDASAPPHPDQHEQATDAGQSEQAAGWSVAGEPRLADGSDIARWPARPSKAETPSAEREPATAQPPRGRSAQPRGAQTPAPPAPLASQDPEPDVPAEAVAAELQETLDAPASPLAKKLPAAPRPAPMVPRAEEGEAQAGAAKEAPEAEAEGESEAAPLPAIDGAFGLGAVPAADPLSQSSQPAPGARRSAQRPRDKAPAVVPQVEASRDLPEEQPETAAAALADRAPRRVTIEVPELPKAVLPAGGDAPVKAGAPVESPAQVASTSSSPEAQQSTAASPAQAATAPGAEQMERVRFVQRVARAFEAAGEQGGSIRLRLHPPELGALRIELTVRHGTISARLETETPEARNLLLDNLPALRDRLADQNIKVQRFDIEWMESWGGESGQRWAGHPRPEPSPAGDSPHHGRPRQPAAETLTVSRPASLYGQGTGFDVTV